MSKIQQPQTQVLITTGDTDGVGLEVAVKALLKVGRLPGVRFVLFKDTYTPSFLRSKLALLSRRLGAKSLEILDLSTPPPEWVKEAAQMCLKEPKSVLVTGPLSKEIIRACGINEIGHTEILKTVTKSSSAYMAFLGKEFNVALATDHIRLSEIHRQLSVSKILEVSRFMHQFKSYLSDRIQKKPLALVGLNPHAGESGIIGDEELEFYPDVLSQLMQENIPVVGPLVPDAAFLKQNWNKYAAYICPYHDQGLIPFKMIHGQNSGVHVTLGLPIVRTSVDHGTAKDIYGQNRANPSSMIAALQWAVQLSRKRLNRS